MGFMVKSIAKIYEELKELLGDRLELIEIIDGESSVIRAKLDGIPFAILYVYKKIFRATTTLENKSILDELRPVLRKVTNGHREHFGYTYHDSETDTRIPTVEWNFENPDLLHNRLLNCSGYSDVVFYNGGMAGYPSLYAQRHKCFIPLPEEQRMTEEGLIRLERRIAKAAAKNERILIDSEYEAMKSMPCGVVEKEGKHLVKDKKK